MRTLTNQEAAGWFSHDDIKVGELWYPRYRARRQHEFFVAIPAEFRKILSLATKVATARYFAGGCLWLRMWNGSGDASGWRTLEGIRRSHGELRSLEAAPGQLFREDELQDLIAFLAPTMGFGWAAAYKGSASDFIFYFKTSGQIHVMGKSAETLEELRRDFAAWSPTDTDPLVDAVRASERRHRAKK